MPEIVKKSLAVIKQGFDSLMNLKKDKREYREYAARVKAMPADYAFVYEKMVNYMWGYAGGGDGYDMLKLQYDLIELFETSAAEGKRVLEVTGEDVAAFCDELLRNSRTWTGDRREALNREIMKKLGKRDESK